MHFTLQNHFLTVFLSRFGEFLESSLIFTKKYVHLLKQFVQTEPHNTLPFCKYVLFHRGSDFLLFAKQSTLAFILCKNYYKTLRLNSVCVCVCVRVCVCVW